MPLGPTQMTLLLSKFYVTNDLDNVCKEYKNSILQKTTGRPSLVAQNLPAIQETWVQSLGWEDRLEEGMTTHSSILAWRLPWTEEPGGLQSMGLKRVRHD